MYIICQLILHSKYILLLVSYIKIFSWDQHCGIANKACVCNAPWFMSRLLYIQSGFQVMAWKKTEDDPNIWFPATHFEDLNEAPGA